MERNAIPLQNINRNLNQEERQEINNPTVETNNSPNTEARRLENGLAACTLFTVAVFFLLIIAYFFGVESCKRSRN